MKVIVIIGVRAKSQSQSARKRAYWKKRTGWTAFSVVPRSIRRLGQAQAGIGDDLPNAPAKVVYTFHPSFLSANTRIVAVRTFASKSQDLRQQASSAGIARPTRSPTGRKGEAEPVLFPDSMTGNQASVDPLQAKADQELGRAEGQNRANPPKGTPGNQLEQKADQLADAVMAVPVRQHSAHRGGLVSSQTTRRPQGVPASVDNVLTHPGKPMQTDLRQDMEQRFGHDFSRVRVHTGLAAERSARDVHAQAYTLGPHIVFGAGQFAPSTNGGRWLIAHELSHVVQQHTIAEPRVMRKTPPNMGRMPEGEAQPATAADRREFAETAIEFLEGQGEFFAMQPDRDTSEVLGHMRSIAENALNVVAGDSGAERTAERLRSTYSEAVRRVLVSRTTAQQDQVRTPPTLRELYERHRDDILPFALPQATVDTGAHELSDELSAELPADATREQRTRHRAVQAARQRLRVITSEVTLSYADLFSTEGGSTSVSLPEGTTARFSSTIPANLQRGLRSLAAQINDSPLVANSTVMLALDLTPYGGGYDSYRFTRLDLGDLGTEILIERQGSIGIEAPTTEQRTALRERFDRAGFRRSGFSAEEFDQMLIGLGEIPEARLATLSGLRFERASSDPEHPDEAAHYDQSTHTVRVFDRAYGGGLTRLGRAGRPLTFAAHAVAHEIGHALDLAPLRTTAAATAAAQEALLAGTSYEIPHRRDPRRERFDELNSAVTSATRAERGARSLSGARWTTGDPAEVTDELAARARQPEFRSAAMRDGGRTRRMPTDYPNPESVWQEYFADSFALYQASPELLQRIRPNVYNFMAEQFPR
jgi:hypothetical protein